MCNKLTTSVRRHRLDAGILGSSAASKFQILIVLEIIKIK